MNAAARFDRPDHAAEVKRRLNDPRAVCAALGLIDRKTKRQPRGVVVCCPAHDDRNPSCSVRVGDDGTIQVKCQSCGWGGDVFSLIAERLKLKTQTDFPEVLTYAADLAGVDLDEGQARRTGRALAPMPAPAAPSGPPPVDEATFGNVAATLLNLSPLDGSVAVGLAARGVLFDAQRDGWAELPANYVLPPDEAARSVEDGYAAEDLAADRAVAALKQTFEPSSLRWLVRGDKFVFAEHRLVIPWRRPDGTVWGLQRRYAPLYGDESPVRMPKYVWPKGDDYAPVRRYAYGVDAPELAAAEEIWLVEGAIDALALRALNRNASSPRPMAALAIPGVRTWAAHRESVVKHVRGRRVLVSLDDDKAGDSAVDAIAADVREAGAKAVVRSRPKGAKDWAELSAKLYWEEETSDERHRRRARERLST